MPTQQEIDDFKQDVTVNVDNKNTRASIKRVKIGGFYRQIADWFSEINNQFGKIVTTNGVINSSSPALTINWNSDLVPGETITWLEKHGPLQLVDIRTERPTPPDPDSPFFGYFQQTLDSYKNSNYTSLILDNGGDQMRWLITSVQNIPEPPGENNYVDDYIVDGYVE